MADPRLGSLAGNPELDQWVDLSTDARVVIRTGKVELGQGIRTALTAIAADELGVDPQRVEVVAAVTGVSPNEWVTAGSGSIEQSGAAVRQACAHARRILLARAADRLGALAASLTVDDGTVSAPSGGQATYWELVGSGFRYRVEGAADPLAPSERRWAGGGLPRVDLPAKVRGEAAFVHDLVLPGMRYGRVVRPPAVGATVVGDVPDAVDGADVVRRGSFLAVVADRERDAVRAADALAGAVAWSGGVPLAADCDDPDHMEANVDASVAIVAGSPVDDPPGPPLDHAGIVVRARYSKPFILHGAIGPSAAVAVFDDGRLRVWSHSQGIEILRLTLADALGLGPDAVTVAHMDGPGCYGHNGADDVALDAALVAMARPGRPISLQWSRADEHGWEPLAPAMCIRLAAGVDGGGRITSWDHDVCTYPHVGRPFPGGASATPPTSGLLATWYFDPPLAPAVRGPSRGFHSGGHRNADPLYDVGDRRIVKHEVRRAAPRTSSTRSLGAFANVFAIESFMDELALAAAVDPVAFRLAHLSDPRARRVIDAVVDLAGGLDAPGGDDAPGRGLAFAQYENCKAYCAVVAEVDVVPRSGEVRFRRAWIAADAGEVIDPDGLVNQLEGGLVQAASWTLKERVGLGPSGVTTRDWESYPILRFHESPTVETRLVPRPDQPALGAGEASAGPTAAALANAVFQATGARLRDLPLTPDRVKAALASLL